MRWFILTPSTNLPNVKMRKRLLRRAIFEPFKALNYSHFFPTRYALRLERSKGVVSSGTFSGAMHIYSLHGTPLNWKTSKLSLLLTSSVNLHNAKMPKRLLRTVIIKPILKSVNYSPLFPSPSAIHLSSRQDTFKLGNLEWRGLFCHIQ
jgi:hypothetical protein